jgi:tetratricopeptide (TPR) repeat protein
MDIISSDCGYDRAVKSGRSLKTMFILKWNRLRNRLLGFVCISSKTLWLIAAIIMMLLTSCESNFEKGRRYLDQGKRDKALGYFEKVQEDDKDFAGAQSYAREIKDQIALSCADSNYAAGDYERAEEFYRQISTPDSLTSLRVLVCSKLRVFNSIEGLRLKYSALRDLLSRYNKKEFNRFEIGPDLPHEPGPGWDPETTLRDEFYIDDSGQTKKRYSYGAFAQAFCAPWGQFQIRTWHTGYYWEGNKFIIIFRFVRTAYGGQWEDTYLLADREVPKRRFQVFLVQNIANGTVTNEFGESFSVKQAEVVAALGFNQGDDEGLVLTVGNLAKYFEQIFAKLTSNPPK